jgi:hypothetical protein
MYCCVTYQAFIWAGFWFQIRTLKQHFAELVYMDISLRAGFVKKKDLPDVPNLI